MSEEFTFSQGHKQELALLSSTGHFFVKPEGCKDYIHDALAGLFYPEYTKLWSIWHPGSGREGIKDKNSPNLDAPEFVLFCGIKSREKNAEKFAKIIGQLEEKIGLEDRTITVVPEKAGVSKTAGAFVACAPSFWIKSPVLVSAYCTFLRLTIRMHTDEDFDTFVERMMNPKTATSPDAGYLRIARKNGNLAGLIEKSLPCMHREGFSDYLLSDHGRGFAWYHAESDAVYPMDEKRLKILRIDGRIAQLNRKGDV